MDSKWPIWGAKKAEADLKLEEAAATVTEEVAVEVAEEEVEERETESSEPTSRAIRSSILQRGKEVVSKASPEVITHSTDNRELVEARENRMRRRVAMAEATGEASQIKDTSKVSSMAKVFLKKMHLRNWARPRRRRQLLPQLPRKKEKKRLRKKRSLRRKLKKSFSASASMISLLQEMLVKKLRQERLKASRVSTSSPAMLPRVKKNKPLTRRTPLPEASRVATSFLDLPPLLKRSKKTNIEVVAPAGVAEEAEEVGQTGRTNLLLPREVTPRRLSRG